ncbi:cyclopropane-fatty-acyl-phospholipid synthase family protein [Myxococcota bacterium]|nr:cyclopropane-fatty-acyl-phospholipid synthase family protein [Myxococcota bacterium]
MNVPEKITPEVASEPNEERFIDRWARGGVFATIGRIQLGEVVVQEGDSEVRFGNPATGPSARIVVLDGKFFSSMARRGAMGAAESYIAGDWRSPDLTALIQVVALNRKALDHLDSRLAKLFHPFFRVIHWMHDNSRKGSRRNIAEHYDLGNDFFELFLDPTLTYSCALFTRKDMSLEEASLAKYERICQKLNLQAGDRVLEVGTGWGGFAIHAVSQYDCHVTTTTISEEQFLLARERIKKAGFEDRVTVLMKDYRDLEGTFDKLVSIEMIEAVGHQHWDEYFRACSERLTPQGIMAIQAISVRDQDFSSSKVSVDFIKKYIFPGGQLVSHAALIEAMSRASDLHVVHFEDITAHYAETLKRWRSQLFENLDKVKALGLPDAFIAMWEFYLCYCEGSFRERSTYGFQMVFEKPLCRRTPILGEIPAILSTP